MTKSQVTEAQVTEAPVRVGLVGAGPWATLVHAPVLAAGPETELVGVWARRPPAAAELAGAHGVRAFERYEDLIEQCDAVAFAVAPMAQASLAPLAARAGKALLLEKPLADTLTGAEALAGVIAETGVPSLVVLTNRFATPTREFLASAASFDAVGGRACFFSGALLGGVFAESPWRQERGALLDVGPHAIDLIDAALGPVVDLDVRASADRRWFSLALSHEGGTVSEVALCCHSPGDSRTDVELYGTSGRLFLDARADAGATAWPNLRADLAHITRTRAAHKCDAQRALHLQRLIDQAERQLRGFV